MGDSRYVVRKMAGVAVRNGTKGESNMFNFWDVEEIKINGRRFLRVYELSEVDVGDYVLILDSDISFLEHGVLYRVLDIDYCEEVLYIQDDDDEMIEIDVNRDEDVALVFFV